MGVEDSEDFYDSVVANTELDHMQAFWVGLFAKTWLNVICCRAGQGRVSDPLKQDEKFLNVSPALGFSPLSPCVASN